MRLDASTARRLPSEVELPVYARAEQRIGLVHLGLGAFHRAHQAVYTDDAMNAGDRDWAIAGVSLRAAGVRDLLAPQDGLYTVTSRDGERNPVRLIGAVARVIVAPEDPVAVFAVLAAASTQIVTMTVTEKGYHRTSDGGLDVIADDVAADLSGVPIPRTIYGQLGAALAARRNAGHDGLTLVCCDNLANNGEQLARLLGEFLERRDPGLARWVRDECACPATMVDRIVPASTAAFLDRTASRIGMRDEAAIATEPFRQWVIEDRFAGLRPRWEAGGAEFVADVRAYETMKLRMLNGAHSALAYLGLERGHVFVHEAIEDPAIRPLVMRLMSEEAAQSLEPAVGRDLGRYADALLVRFANPALGHRLAQIAMDGSQKIPQRWLATLRVRSAAGHPCPAILEALAAWIVHVRGGREPVEDPAAESLARLWREAGKVGITAALFGPNGRFAADWCAEARDQSVLRDAIARRVA
ncbi:MAG: mannitol dehydrogenase family protein [Pseudomonadota bacterium]